MSYPIPSAAWDDRIGILGTSGSGKTYTAGTLTERLLAKKARVVIVDPLGVWWGLRLAADGKHASPFKVVIFGGPRGDLPLTEHAGALLGQTAATMAESCIIDLSELKSKAAERRFMTAFLETIYRAAPGEPFHLIVDEADLFAPQKPAGGDETLLGHMENIVRRGRVKGFIPWLISQRPAVLNKNVLSQVDGLVAFKLTSSQDRDALDSWIEGQADKAQGREIKDTLPTMEVGQGVVWLPGHGILRTAQFPLKETFDSSRTPKRGEKKKRTAALKPVDVGALKGQLAAVEEEAKASDPKKLRAEITGLKAEKAKLEKQVADAGKKVPAKAPPDKAALEEARKEGFEQAQKKLENASKRALIKAKREALKTVALELTKFANIVGEALRNFDVEEKALAIEFTPAPAPRSVPSAPPRSPAPANWATPVVPRQLLADDGSFTRPQMKVLEALTMWRDLGHEAPTREMVAVIAGYSATSGGFNNLLSVLRTMGAIDYPQQGQITLLADNIGIMSPAEGVTMLLANLANPQKKIIGALLGRGERTREELGADTGYSATSGGYNNLLGGLRTIGLIDYPRQGVVMMTDWAEELLAPQAGRIAA